MRVVAHAILAAGLVAALLAQVLVLRAADRLPEGGAGWVLMAFPVVVAIGLAACFRLPAATRASVALTMAAMAAGLYLAEVWLWRQDGAAAESGPAAIGDGRAKIDVIRALRAGGRDAFPALFPAYLLQTQADGTLASPIRAAGRPVLPLAGVAHADAVLCNESGEWIVYGADERGFANPAGAWSAEATPVVLLGDSFTQGYCVRPEASFAGLLRRRWPAALNLAASGNGPLAELAALAEYGPERRPKRVLWFFFEGNDVPVNLAVERRAPVLMDYLDGRRQNLEADRPAIDRAVRDHLDGLLGQSVAATDAGPLQNAIGVFTLSRVRGLLRLPAATSARTDWALFERVLRTARDLAAGWGGQVTVVYLPDWPSLVPGADPARRAELDGIHTGVETSVRNLGLTLVDLRPAFAAHPDPAALFARRRPNHYSEEGHALVARQVLDAIQERP